MKIKSLQLKNFKRFTDLTLQSIPENARLVLLIGANGSGKSSVFDAFSVLSEQAHNERTDELGNTTLDRPGSQGRAYYQKNAKRSDVVIEFYENLRLRCTFTIDDADRRSLEAIGTNPPNLFYGRSAVRYVPRITRTTIGQTVDINTDSDRPRFYIDADQRFENDLDLLIKEVIEKVFQRINTENTKQLDEIRRFFDPINEAFPRIFGTENDTMLSFKHFVPPADGKPSRLIFQKGVSELDYDLLSAGEKEVVNLLFNLFVRRRAYTNTIYFLDEIDTHLNTKLQYNLLKEITENWIPPNCQLWTASHSLGFIDYANDSNDAVIFDFDDLDFDQPQTLQPTPKNDAEVFEIAVGKAFIDRYMYGKKIIFSENTDTPFYNDLGLENVLFAKANDKIEAFHRASNFKQFALLDRDYLSDADITIVKTVYPFVFILPFYSFENLLYHPNNLEEYYSSRKMPFTKADYIAGLTKAKNEVKDSLLMGILQARNGYPFFKENEKAEELKRFRKEYNDLARLIGSNAIEDFYKIFPMKDYATQLPERQNLSKTALAKTAWFKQQIEAAVQ